MIPADPRIRYFRETPRRRVGTKRNSACDKAQGDITAHWDDDWYAPWRLSYQVEELKASGAAICGLDRILFLDEAAHRASILPAEHPGWPAPPSAIGATCGSATASRI